MDVNGLRASLANDAPPPALSLPLQALWWQAKGDWHRAHRCCQDTHDAQGAWAHAYLHRVEGDLSNAGGWYRRAQKTPSTAPLESEWDEIATALLVR
jgi:hypothetical protein